jgi:hypothetical protein
MKQITVFGFFLLMLLSSVSFNAQDNKKALSQKVNPAKVEVYYFYYTRRCNTCKSVEATSKQAFEALYADKIKSGLYSFKALNLDEASSKAIARKLGIGGQTLLLVCGTHKVDITDKGFMNSNNLVKMKELIKKAVEQVLKG